MNRTVKSLLSAGTAALALAGTAARADKPAWAHHPAWARQTTPVAQPIPSVLPDEPCPAELADFRELAFERHEYRRLEHERARFYRRWNGNPWARQRFERWYGERLAELRARADARREEWREEWREQWREQGEERREHHGREHRRGG